MPSPVTIPAISQTWTPANVPTDAYVEIGSASQAPGLGSAKMLLSQIGSTINVKNYGAVGDGTTNDTAAIAAAFTAAADGATVYFPAGTYAITTITLHKGIHLVGDGPYASTIKRLAAGVGVASDLLFFEANGGVPLSAVSLDGLGFDHAWNGSLSSVYSCVTIYEANAVTIRNCYFTRGQYHGVKMNGCFDTNVTGCRFYRCTYDGIGIGGPGGLPLLRRATDVRITGNSFEDVFGGVIVQVGVDRVVVANNQFVKSTIQFGQDVTGININNNVLKGLATYGAGPGGNPSLIFVETATGCVIANNQVFDVTAGTGVKRGIWVVGSELAGVQMACFKVLITGNVINNVTNYAIGVNAQSFDGSVPGSDITITGNQISGSGDGMDLTNFSDGLISGNQIFTPQFTGITATSVTNATFSENTVINPSDSNPNSYYGIHFATGCANISVNGNTLIDTRGSSKMRFGVYDEVVNGCVVNASGNVISGAITNIPWYPTQVAPTAGTWKRGNTIQCFDDGNGKPKYFICIAAGTPGTWRAGGGQISWKDTGGGSPVGVFDPDWIGEECFDTVNKNWYKATGLTNADWKIIT